MNETLRHYGEPGVPLFLTAVLCEEAVRLLAE